MKRILPLCVAVLLMPAMSRATVIVNDSWADGGRTDGVDTEDTDWWTSTSSQAIEVSVGSLGLVSGTSGRGIHGTFGPQTLAVGYTLTATYTFTTPATVTTATSGGAQFKIGVFDTTGHNFAQDVTASTSTEWNNLNGYETDFDVGPLTSGSANITFRQRTDTASSALLSTTAPYTQIGTAGGNAYSFAANTTYIGVLSLTRTGADSLDLSGSLYQGASLPSASLLSTWTVSDSSGIVGTIGALAFHVNSSIFGSSNTPGQDNNGIDFSNIKIEYGPVPEPSATAIFALGAAGLLLRRRLKR